MTKKTKLCARPFAWQVGMVAGSPSLPLSGPRDRARDIWGAPTSSSSAPQPRPSGVTKAESRRFHPLFPHQPFHRLPISCTLVFRFQPPRQTPPFQSATAFASPTRRRRSESAISIQQFAPAVNSARKFHPATLHPRHKSPPGSIGTDYPPKPPLFSPTSATLAALIHNGAHETQQ
ncbi:hypothetical protein B0T18DRAFT_54397 [Schizothecium vesticola]|uniref:Uncharacterized protein n=1 Tax=Schizothecium vesticola TaxID=314040 RepID=A0AA40KDH2_9PEZI|nr:hypothetical protein B0T18DRAFT_54397 [Schizothecium vesticola]